jgi:hypothetical protein
MVEVCPELSRDSAFAFDLGVQRRRFNEFYDASASAIRLDLYGSH